MWPLGVVVDEPGVEISLECFDAVVEGVAHGHAEELVEDGAVETLDKAVGAGCPHLGTAVLDAGEMEIKFVGMSLGAAELGAIARWELWSA